MHGLTPATHIDSRKVPGNRAPCASARDQAVIDPDPQDGTPWAIVEHHCSILRSSPPLPQFCHPAWPSAESKDMRA
jgi:hypothetical protein